MRCADYLWMKGKGPVFRRFFFEYINCRACNLARIECFNKRLFINNSAPCAINNHDALFHLGKGIFS